MHVFLSVYCLFFSLGNLRFLTSVITLPSVKYSGQVELQIDVSNHDLGRTNSPAHIAVICPFSSVVDWCQFFVAVYHAQPYTVILSLVLSPHVTPYIPQVPSTGNTLALIGRTETLIAFL